MTRATLIGAIAIGLLVPSGVGAQPAGKPTRELVKSHEPIQNRLAPADRFVTIKRPGSEEPAVESESPEIEMQSLSLLSELVVLHQIAVEPYLSDEGSWIRTRMKGRVSQVFKSESLGLLPGASVEFEMDGGEMIVKGVRVRAGSPPEITTRPHFIALYLNPRTKGWELATGFEIGNDDTLQPMSRLDKSAPRESKLRGKPLAEIEAGLAKRRQK